MNTKFPLLIASIIIVFLIPIHSPADEKTETTRSFEMGIEAYENGDYDNAINELAPLIDQLKLVSIDRIVKTHSILGACQYLKGDEGKSKSHFEAVLNFDSDHELDRAYFTPKVVRFFDQLKAVRKLIHAVDNMNEEIDSATANHPIPEQEKSFKVSGLISKDPFIGDTDMPNPYINNFIPFGIAQFKNNSPGMGYFFMASQGLTFTTALVSGILFAAKKDSQGAAPTSTVSGLKTAFIASFPLFLAFYGMGIADACIHYRKYPYKEINEPGLSLGFDFSRGKNFLVSANMIFR